MDIDYIEQTIEDLIENKLKDNIKKKFEYRFRDIQGTNLFDVLRHTNGRDLSNSPLPIITFYSTRIIKAIQDHNLVVESFLKRIIFIVLGNETNINNKSDYDSIKLMPDNPFIWK